MNIVMMGIQGSGKGTQSKLLARYLGLPHISVGDLFRWNIRQGTALGAKAKTHIDKGDLVPDAVVMDMVQNRLAQEDARRGFVLDGFPRNGVQLAAMEFMRPVDHAVLLELDENTAMERLASRSECPRCHTIYGANRSPKKDGFCDECEVPLKVRSDDQDAAAVRRRLQLYEQEISILVSYYNWKGVLRRVDGSGSVDEIHARIRDAVAA